MGDLISRKNAAELLKKCTWGKTQKEALAELMKIPAEDAGNNSDRKAEMEEQG